MIEATDRTAITSMKRSLVRGCVLYWGVPCSFLFAMAMSNTFGEGFWFWLLISLPGWCLGGYVFGRVLCRRLDGQRPA